MLDNTSLEPAGWVEFWDGVGFGRVIVGMVSEGKSCELSEEADED